MILSPVILHCCLPFVILSDICILDFFQLTQARGEESCKFQSVSEVTMESKAAEASGRSEEQRRAERRQKAVVGE